MSLYPAHFLGPESPLARRIAGFESRPEQLRMAEAVEANLESKGRLLVEAGTGVGKSFGYLVPAIRRILERRERVVVCTHTISLQEQIFEKDVPLLKAVIPDEFTTVLCKGRANYVSLRRLRIASEKKSKICHSEEEEHSLDLIEDWAYDTDDGSLATLPQLPRRSVWEHVESDAGNCMGRRCPNYDKCFYQSARRRMENADLLICNHALFFSDLALRSKGAGFLPAYDHVIFDEAHHLEDVASGHFGIRVSESRAKHVLRTLYNATNGRGTLAGIEASVAGGSGLPTEEVDAVIRAALDAQAAAESFFDGVWRAGESGAGAIGPSGRVAGPDAFPNPLSPVLGDLATSLKLLRERSTDESLQFDLGSAAQRVADLAAEIDLFIGQGVEGCVYWVERGRQGYGSNRPLITLSCATVDVGPVLRDRLFSMPISITMTSATLAASGRDFSHIVGRLGADGANTLALGSPFDYASQMRVMIDRSMPTPDAPEANRELVPRILRNIEETGGGAFVLFTSFRALREVAERCAPVLRSAGYPVFIHGEDGERSQLLKRFREHDHSVLFGTASFWEGVDVRGRALRNVIITKLPFDVPDHPLIQARHEKIEAAGGNAFRDDQLPRAVLRFKQGIGRLIRSAEDSGRIVILDPRILTKFYGKRFLGALPDGVEPEHVGV
ncbi:MAG: DEAD/DEAH box helicase [Planctomycetaceae bacterium]|nr:DEAD/DEAH box helicase [Planctomycetaceae bacterium]